MKATLNIACILGIVAVLVFPHLPDVVIPVDGGQSKIEAAFSDQLAAYFTEIANADKSIQEKEIAIGAAFGDSGKVAYEEGLKEQIEHLTGTETDTGSLDELLLKVAGELQ